MQDQIINTTKKELAIKLNKILLGLINKEDITEIILRTQSYITYRLKELDPSEFTEFLQKIQNTTLTDLTATEKILERLDSKAPYFKIKNYQKTVEKGNKAFRELFSH